MAKKIAGLSLRTGRRTKRVDPQTLKFADVIRAGAKAPPAEYDVDKKYPEIGVRPIPMFLNNELGCCVISGRAHQTLRFEYIEQGGVIRISDSEIRSQYLDESEGEDNGLVVLDSLNSWRKDGWRAGGRRYKIDVYAEIDKDDREQFKTAIYMKVGIGLGIFLPNNYNEVFRSGQHWDGSLAGSTRNGHYVYATGYNADGLTFITWGERRFMTWDFVERNCDEGYAIVDDIDKFDDAASPFDADAANEFLDSLN